MFGPFRKLHRKDREIFIINVIRVIGSFQIHEEKLWKLNDSWSKEINWFGVFF